MMPQAATVLKGLGQRSEIVPSRRHNFPRPAACARHVSLISASKEGHWQPATSSVHLVKFGNSWLKTGLMAGACFFIGFGSGAAHASKQAPPETIAVVEQRATDSPAAAGSGGVKVVTDWQRRAKDVQASPYTVPAVVVVLLVAGIGMLGSRNKKETAQSSSGRSSGDGSSAALPPAEVSAPSLPAEVSAPPPPPPPAPTQAAPVLVTARPMTVMANPNMAAPPPRQPVATTPQALAVTAAPAAPLPLPPPSLPPAPAAPALEAPVTTAASPSAALAPAPAPPPAPAVVPVDTRPSAKEWIANWRASQPTKSALEPVPAPAPPMEAPQMADADRRPSAKEWIANWRAKSAQAATVMAPLPPPPAPSPSAPPVLAPAPPAVDSRLPAKEWIANWRASQASAVELLTSSSSRPDAVVNTVNGIPVVISKNSEYVVFKFGDGVANATPKPISVLQPPPVQPSGASGFDSTVSSDDVDEPAPAKAATAVTVAAATVVQGPSHPPALATRVNGTNLSTAAMAVPAAASNGRRETSSSTLSSSLPTASISSGATSGAARDPIVMTAAVVVGAARQMKGFGAFVSDGLVPAVGALLGAGNITGSSKSNRR